MDQQVGVPGHSIDVHRLLNAMLKGAKISGGERYTASAIIAAAEHDGCIKPSQFGPKLVVLSAVAQWQAFKNEDYNTRDLIKPIIHNTEVDRLIFFRDTVADRDGHRVLRHYAALPNALVDDFTAWSDATENGMMLDAVLHIAYDDFRFCLMATEEVNKYTVHWFGNVVPYVAADVREVSYDNLHGYKDIAHRYSRRRARRRGVYQPALFLPRAKPLPHRLHLLFQVFLNLARRTLHLRGYLEGSSRKLRAEAGFALLRQLSALVRPGQDVVLVDNTSSNEVAALYPQFLGAGINVITPNKKAFSAGLDLYERILAASLESGARFLNEATVVLACRSSRRSRPLDRDKVENGRQDRGCISGTMSYIFNEFSSGKEGGPSFSSVVRVAREKGYTEPHPADDLNGADVARKLTILSRYIPSLRSALADGYQSVNTNISAPSWMDRDRNEFMKRLPEFDAHFDKMRSDAFKENNVLRFVGVVDVNAGVIKADLEKSRDTSICDRTWGSDNIIMFHTERYGARPLVVQGAGAGAAPTLLCAENVTVKCLLDC
ncbi:putative homoserine dehydrogenase [Grifola frondosa]|uniref:Homoserine dehydrogenase n=1 Tax=Grifola frondosa TaxID=5627 RepID=A0A1C7LT01_GRIFR|nr:putative homoserine dehydrogenase [Grifola frondosa]